MSALRTRAVRLESYQEFHKSFAVVRCKQLVRGPLNSNKLHLASCIERARKVNSIYLAS